MQFADSNHAPFVSAVVFYDPHLPHLPQSLQSLQSSRPLQRGCSAMVERRWSVLEGFCVRNEAQHANSEGIVAG